MLFEPGNFRMTPGFAQELDRTEGREQIWPFLRRHLTGDWGELDAEDKRVNDLAVKHGDRILSAYHFTTTNVKFYIITEADRSVTTFLLPEEY